ncbi:transposable element Tc1 transposase [Trichonephila clavipes]|nr:transposable element Tc1 transposase [Trichonephila clavipes]
MCSRRHGGGRIRSTTPTEDIYRPISKRNGRTTAQQVANQFLTASGKQISRKTVARHESRFSLSSDCRRQLIWRESGTAYRPENIQEKDRYPTCSIMVWAGIMTNGRTRLHVVANGTMTGQRYIDEVLLPHVRLFRGAVGDKFVFMDDNATYLNPIENVWDALGRQVAGRNYPPINKNTLIRALTEEWDKLPQQLLDNVVQSMNTVFGYVVSGSAVEATNNNIHGGLIRDSDLNTTLMSFFELESIGVQNENCNSEEDISLEMFKQRVHFKNGNEVKHPWKRDGNELSDNFSLAKRRLGSIMRKMPNDKMTVRMVYRFNRVRFSLNASPFLLAATVLKTRIGKYMEKYPDTVRTLDHCFYVDDLITGEDDAKSAFDLSITAAKIMSEAGINLRKWISNDCINPSTFGANGSVACCKAGEKRLHTCFNEKKFYNQLLLDRFDYSLELDSRSQQQMEGFRRQPSKEIRSLTDRFMASLSWKRQSIGSSNEMHQC